MTTITASEVNKLRQMTGAGMMDCKNALVETQGDFEAAVDYLRKKGAKIAAKRADREATEGCVIAMVNESRSAGVIVLLACETDFVAKNEAFVELAKSITSLAMDNKPADLDALKALSLNGVAVADRLMDEVAKIGEKIDVTKYELVEGSNVVSYIHGSNRMGVLVEKTNACSCSNVLTAAPLNHRSGSSANRSTNQRTSSTLLQCGIGGIFYRLSREASALLILFLEYIKWLALSWHHSNGWAGGRRCAGR